MNEFIIILQCLKMHKKTNVLIGGQPGAGKSSFYSNNEALNEYIIIDGDSYRRFHPNYDNIIKFDMENYASRTQSFVNMVVEKLITDLSDKRYNLLIEGTLRDPDVPIKTCEYLNSKGYNTNLVIVACNAEISWNATITRAKLMQEMGQKPRFVPIDKYNNIVNNLPHNVDIIQNKKCFHTINIINRNNELLYSNNSQEKASDIIEKVLNLKQWNQNINHHINNFMQEKINTIKKEIDAIER